LLPWLKDLLEHPKHGGIDIYSAIQCQYLIQSLQDIQNLLQCNCYDNGEIYAPNVDDNNNNNNNNDDKNCSSSNNGYDNSKVKTNSYDVFPDLKKIYGFQKLLSIIEKNTIEQLSSIWFPMLKTSSSIKSISFYYKQLNSIYIYIRNIKLLLSHQLLRSDVISPCVWNVIVLQSGTAMIKLLNSTNEQV